MDLIKKIKKTLPERSGFTLVEILVSISIFALAMTVVTQLFIYSLRAEKRLVAHSQLINEMSYNMEHFARDIRMAKKRLQADPAPYCLSTVGVNFDEIKTGGIVTGLKFKNTNLSGGIDCIQYYACNPSQPCYSSLGLGALGYSGVTALIESHAGTNGTFDLPVTSPKINITNFKLVVVGESQEDEIQPRVTMYIQAKNEENEVLESQLTVSQRDIDYRED
ncbi:MAG: prepilin-type N-terminal cleavage/methylation domain-containing protein [Candidatus Paceibacterota bacterium]